MVCATMSECVAASQQLEMLICTFFFVWPLSIKISHFSIDWMYLYFEWHLFAIVHSTNIEHRFIGRKSNLYSFWFLLDLAGCCRLSSYVVFEEHFTSVLHAVKTHTHIKNECLEKNWQWACCDYSYHMDVINYFLCAAAFFRMLLLNGLQMIDR